MNSTSNLHDSNPNRPTSITGRIIGTLRGRLIVLFGGVSLLLGIVSSVVIENRATQAIARLSDERLHEIARSIANTLSQSLVERRREIELVSALPHLVSGEWNLAAVRTIINAVKDSYRPYAWMGLADSTGRVIVASGGLLEGVDVSKRPWFIHGKQRIFTGDVHEALLLARHLQPDDASEPLRFIDFAAPVYDATGRYLGVVATHAHWTWIAAVINEGIRTEHLADGITVFLMDQKNRVLHPFSGEESTVAPVAPESSATPSVVTSESGQKYLTARANIVGPGADDLNWSVVVRQPLDVALGTATQLQHTMLWLGIALSLLLIILADRVAISFSRPLQELEKTAARIDGGDETTRLSATPSGIYELDSLSGSLNGLTGKLLDRKHALETLNQSLEGQVLARTAELTQANALLAALATTDGLTGVANRRQFDTTLQNECDRAHRSKAPLSLIMLDIDFFKKYNDHYGHQAGDECLRDVAQALKATINRPSDLVARYGGEEFAVILPGTALEDACTIAQKLSAAIGALDRPHANSPLGRVTISLGVAVLSPEQDHDATRLLSHADTALYAAKTAGRNRFCTWNAPHA